MVAVPPEHLIDEGRGPALLFLHHFGGSGRSWSRVIDRVAERHRCIAPDLPGFGSACDWTGSFTIAASVAPITALIARFGLADYRIVGHSMGGKIALAIAARRPRGLRDLILVAPSPPTPEPIAEAERARLIASWGNRGAMAAIVEKISVRPLSQLDREQQVADMLATSKAAWEAWLGHGSREDISSSLPKISLPVTIVAGGADQTITPALLRRELLQHVPTATMSIIPGAGHLLPMEAYDEVADIILRANRRSAAEADGEWTNGWRDPETSKTRDG